MHDPVFAVVAVGTEHFDEEEDPRWQSTQEEDHDDDEDYFEHANVTCFAQILRRTLSQIVISA